MIKIAEFIDPTPSPLWKLAKQAASTSPSAGCPSTTGRRREAPWDYEPLAAHEGALRGRRLQARGDRGAPAAEQGQARPAGRDDEIATVCTLLENMGRLGIPVWCYEWMTDFNWLRTDLAPRRAAARWSPASTTAAVRTRRRPRSGRSARRSCGRTSGTSCDKVLPVAEAAASSSPCTPTTRRCRRFAASAASCAASTTSSA